MREPKTEPKFQIGDRVKFVNASKLWLGHEAIVDEVEWRGDEELWMYTVTVIGIKETGQRFWEYRFELVEAACPPAEVSLDELMEVINA